MNSQQTRTNDENSVETILQVDNVTKRFGGLVAVDDVSFEVEQGTILGVIGPNGAGKTTLFNIVNGFLTPDEGSIHLDNVDLTDRDPSTHAKHGMARTFQLSKPFGSLTVLENVMVGAYLHTSSRDTARELAWEQLELVGLEDIANMPAQNVTVAEKKEMELCRALATQPKVVLVDEIMAGLQQEERTTLLNTLQRINSTGTTVILIEHVMDALMKVSERVIVLNEGSLIADGTTQDISTNNEVIEAYLGESWRKQEENDA